MGVFLMPESRILNSFKCFRLLIIALFLILAINVANSTGLSVSQPVKVVILVDIDNEEDLSYLYDVLDEVESLNWRATVFITGKLASNNPDIIKNIEERGHEIGVQGWDINENLSSLNYTEQLNLISREKGTCTFLGKR
jgi:peptidoglycan/xylan/chitin deacetylase (PgdA/CDA1 family)